MIQTTEQLWRRSPVEIGIMAAVFLFLLGIIVSLIPQDPEPPKTNFCPQPAALTPSSAFRSSAMFYEPEYGNFSLSALQGAVQVPTVSFDDMDLDWQNEPRFKPLEKLHKHLAKTFPLTWRSVERVAGYGLLFTIDGSDKSLKPLVLMAHQDVVPVQESSLDDWDYPPFEAHYDGDFLYGRGTADTKNTLVGILEATEALLKQGWQPKRTLLISFGYDEEIGGLRGGAALAAQILQTYGRDGVEMVVDEGFGMPEMNGVRVAGVTVAEKGAIDVGVVLNTRGGHSSRPPDHTGIGIMSELVKQLELHPFPAELDASNPTLGYFRCLAEHATDMDKSMRYKILHFDEGAHREAVTEYISDNKLFKYHIRTSQAADIVHGGVKINALPEQVELRVNHRLGLSTGGGSILDRFEFFAEKIANEYGLGVISQGETLAEPTAEGFFNISSLHALDAAPVSPAFGAQWDLIAGTTRNILTSGPYKIDEPLVVAPSVFPANTDTHYYWDLTREIYRFCPVFAEDMLAYHTVNERLRFRSHLVSVAWFYEFIINTTV